jgi:hypothetical protein
MNNVSVFFFRDDFNVATKANRWNISNVLSCMVFDRATGARGMTLLIFHHRDTEVPELFLNCLKQYWF